MVSSSGLLAMFLRAPPHEPDDDDDCDNSDGNCSGHFPGTNEVVLNSIPVVTRPECEKRNQGKPDRRRRRDGQDDFEGGKLHCARERRNNSSDTGQKSADKQSREPVPLVELLDPLLGVRPRVFLEPPQKSLRAEASSQSVGDASAPNISEPAEKEHSESGSVG